MSSIDPRNERMFPKLTARKIDKLLRFAAAAWSYRSGVRARGPSADFLNSCELGLSLGVGSSGWAAGPAGRQVQDAEQ